MLDESSTAESSSEKSTERANSPARRRRTAQNVTPSMPNASVKPAIRPAGPEKYGVPRDDLPHLLDGASAFAFPSLYEGFGLPPLEALARGVPTVVSDTSSLPEVVGDAALRHPPGDSDALAEALLRLLEDGRLRARLQAAGPRRAASFSWEQAARETFTVYREARGRAG